jgi:hypothetical protein
MSRTVRCVRFVAKRIVSQCVGLEEPDMALLKYDTQILKIQQIASYTGFGHSQKFRTLPFFLSFEIMEVVSFIGLLFHSRNIGRFATRTVQKNSRTSL